MLNNDDLTYSDDAMRGCLGVLVSIVFTLVVAAGLYAVLRVA